jgi:hypothetical protein
MFNKSKSPKSTFKKLALAGLVFCCLINFVFINIDYIQAAGLEIKVGDDSVFFQDQWNWKNYFLRDQAKEEKQSLGSRLFNATIGKALNKIAYDTATWLGSGSRGQKPVWETRGWDKYLTDIGDEAAGDFLETLGKEWRFNLCEPDFALKMKIGLGLREQVRPSAPACTFTKMKKNWEKELKDPNFLSKFQDMFSPTSNDLGIALSLQTNLIEDISTKKTLGATKREANKGWLDITNLDGTVVSPPNEAEERYIAVRQTMQNTFGNYTGDALVDAANVFLNQLAMTAFNRLMTDVGNKGKHEQVQIPEIGGLINPEAGPNNQGEAGIKEIAGKLLEPNFTERADYDILSELTTCFDPKKAGPTNCVINDKFNQAITEKISVGEAMKKGYLNANGIFGFNADGTEPDYNESYPYRSMIILRKFRILPVGWELAAQYIKTNALNNTAIGTVNLNKLVACFDPGDDYKGYNDNGDQDWCEGLVDPTWVLKAPKNYCKRAGPGPEIVSAQVIGEGKNSQLMIARNNNYCGDEQSCIKENYDGSCQFYGYCTEERRTWNFSSPSCDPKYNTCQTFKKKDGQSVSYLENTLDYGSCTIDNAGCQAYCADYDPGEGCQSTGNKLYLDRDAEQCKETEEGCHEFIRTKAGPGANLFLNSSFEDALTSGGWNSFGAIENADSYNGLSSLKLSGDLDYTRAVAKDNNYSIGGEAFSFSFAAKNCGATGDFGFKDAAGNKIASAELKSGPDWQRFSVSHVFEKNLPQVYQVKIFIDLPSTAADCLIDALKLERGGLATSYSDYLANGLVYEKLAPEYLECDGYEDPAECKKYALKCSAEDVGCELYTSSSDNISIPAKATAADYCPAECIGYDSYVRQESAFESRGSDYFIPKTAQACGAESAGCDEFTNLDKLGEGGEAREYYSYLRQCIKPDVNQCAEFYTWEGSEETGYQLKVFTLKKDEYDSDDNASTDGSYRGDPAITETDQNKCNETIYNLPAADPSHNPDCRQYYNKAGDISYHLYSKTISCSDNCHPYRRTANNIDEEIIAGANCVGSDKHWDDTNNQCLFCKNGGIWNTEHNACLYYAVPNEGLACSANMAGCREYTGNAGANTRIILNNDFEGSAQGWTEGVLSNTSLRVGGESLSVDTSAETVVGNLVEEGKSYILSFIIKPKESGATKINSIKFTNTESGGDTGGEFSLGSLATSISPSWEYYKVNLDNLSHKASSTEKLTIEADNDFYIDDLRLTEITDRYYLIKNSWATPESCDQDPEGNPLALYMLGCDAYADREKQAHNLRSFSGLCSEAKVGCEIMIDTHNSTSHEAETVSGVTTPADNYDYVVYDKTKECPAGDKGCQRLGAPYNYEGDTLYSDVFLKNDPDKYEKILCDSGAIGCQEWSTGDAISYFKDPGDQICEWRQAAGQGSGGWGWYKKKIKRCEAGNNPGDICLTDGDCPEGTCKLSETDSPCPESALKTFGFGGAEIKQPKKDNTNYNWTGICPAAQSGCSEYIDPMSKFSPDLVTGTSQKQAVVNPYTLYIISGNGSVNCAGALLLYKLSGSTNALENGASSLSLTSGSLRFYTGSANSNAITCSISESVELRKAAVDYQLKQDADGKTCNGLVDFETGCVLFNERVKDGANFSSLVYNSDLTRNDGNGIAAQADSSSANNNANKLLKVAPDRVCDKWLACKETVEKISGNTEICASVGICNKFGDNGNCDRFVDPPAEKKNQTYDLSGGSSYLSAPQISDKTGYVKIGYKDTAINMDRYAIAYPDDLYLLGEATTAGLVANIDNGGFEKASDITVFANKYITSNTTVSGNPQTITVEVPDSNTPDIGDPDIPLSGWTCSTNNNNQYMCEIIDDPVESEGERICYQEENSNCFIYAPEGRNYLKLTAGYGEIGTAESYFTSVVGGQSYYLTAFINTLRLSSGQAQVKIEEYKNQQVPYNPARISYPSGLALNKALPWTLKLGSFTTNSETKSIKITLQGYRGNDTGVQGDIYFDFIQIRPVLETKKLADNSYWHTPQSCRLYPTENSLTCDYLDDAGMRRKGWYGHCLEYDRAPGNPNACLTWWPVPHITYRVNEACGDGYANGDEDCDCPIEAQNPDERNCSAKDANNWNINPYGTSNTNQYRCLNCLWTDGWCGDAVVQKDLYNEHCDWNEGNSSSPNLNSSTCWDNKYPALNQEFKHTKAPGDGGSAYNDFLSGSLGCYNSSGSNKCAFDVSGCSDMLVNAQHSREDCREEGGIVVNSHGEEVTDSFGIIKDSSKAGNINGNDPFFCRFGVSNSTCESAYNTCKSGCDSTLNNATSTCRTTYNSCKTGADTNYETCYNNCEKDINECMKLCNNDSACISSCETIFDSCLTVCGSASPCWNNFNTCNKTAFDNFDNCMNDTTTGCSPLFLSCKNGVPAAACPSDWRLYESWSMTDNRHCDGSHANCGGFGCGGATSVNTGAHGSTSLLENKAQETASYLNEGCSFKCKVGNWKGCYSYCVTRNATCYADIQAVGCY